MRSNSVAAKWGSASFFWLVHFRGMVVMKIPSNIWLMIFTIHSHYYASIIHCSNLLGTLLHLLASPLHLLASPLHSVLCYQWLLPNSDSCSSRSPCVQLADMSGHHLVASVLVPPYPTIRCVLKMLRSQVEGCLNVLNMAVPSLYSWPSRHSIIQVVKLMTFTWLIVHFKLNMHYLHWTSIHSSGTLEIFFGQRCLDNGG